MITTNGSLSFLQLSWTTFQSVFVVFVICLCGFLCSYSGLLPKDGQKIISMLNVNLLTPCLIFSKLARSLSLAKLIQLFIIPVFYSVLIGVSYLSGCLVSSLFGLDLDETHFVIGTAVFPNSNSLPVSLMMSLAYSLPQLKWPEIPDDNGDNIASRGILYLLMFQQIDQTLRWLWGVHKLLRWSGEAEESITITEQSSFSTTILDSDTTRTKFAKFSNHLRYHWDNLVSYMNPPLYAIFFSVVAASIQPLKEALFEGSGFLHNTLTMAVDQMADVSIPLILIVLGANFGPSNSTSSMATHNSKNMVFASILSRMILPAIILLPLIALTVKNCKISILTDPAFLLVSFLLTTSPPAIQLTQLTQINEFFEFEIVKVLFWGYVVMTLPMTIAMVSISLTVLEWANQ